MFWTTPKKVIIKGETAAACVPVRFRLCVAYDIYRACSFNWEICAGTPMYLPTILRHCHSLGLCNHQFLSRLHSVWSKCHLKYLLLLFICIYKVNRTFCDLTLPIWQVNIPDDFTHLQMSSVWSAIKNDWKVLGYSYVSKNIFIIIKYKKMFISYTFCSVHFKFNIIFFLVILF